MNVASENVQMRKALAEIIRHCGGVARPDTSVDFLCLAAEEVRLALIAAANGALAKAVAEQ